MSGAEAQAGFYYQNLVAAQYALDLIEFGSQLRSLTLENPKRAKYVDDVIIDAQDGATFVQVKWAESETSAFTLHNLAAADGDEPCLLAKLAIGYRQVAKEQGKPTLILVSTRRAGTNRQPHLGIGTSLREFLDELHQPLLAAEDIAAFRDSTAASNFADVLALMQQASGLPTPDEFMAFLGSIRFKLSQPDRDTLAQHLRTRFALLGIDPAAVPTLLDAVVNWSLTATTVTPDDVRRCLGLEDRFVDRLRHSFPVDRTLWVPTPELFATLDDSLAALRNGFILLEGEPGAGKSTALMMYLSGRAGITFGYFCFVPNDRTLGNERLGEDAFIHSLCVGLRNAFPGVEFSKPFAPHSLALLNEWLQALSQRNKRVILVVDGVDHVDRKSQLSLIANPLTRVLDSAGVPDNVLIVLSSRYPHALPPSLRAHIGSDPRRHVQMRRLETKQVRKFLELRGVSVAEALIEQAVTVSGGIPIYLEYLAEHLRDMNRYQQEKYLTDVPSLRDARIDIYHQHLWEMCGKDQRLRHILAILAVRDEFTTPAMILDLIRNLGLPSTLLEVNEAIGLLRHVLRTSDANSVAIRHSSLAEFVSEQTSAVAGEIHTAMHRWYESNPNTDDAWRNRVRHLSNVADPAAVLAVCDEAWLVRAWTCFRPADEIQDNLSIAWRAAAARMDVTEFVRVALLKQRLALVSKNLDVSDADIARFLLRIDRPQDALRRVWDGEQRRCSAVEFASVLLAHAGKTGRVPPQYIADAGLGDGPGADSGVAESRIWYRARALTGDLSETLNAIQSIKWRQRPTHGHEVTPIDGDEQARMNSDIQCSAVRELAERGTAAALMKTRSHSDFAPAVAAAIHAATAVVLARSGELDEARREVGGIQLDDLRDDDRRWYYLRLIRMNVSGFTPGASFARPALPRSIISHDEREVDESIFELYDELRCWFLTDDAAYAWLETTLIQWPAPASSVVAAVGLLARAWVWATQHASEQASLLADIQNAVSRLDIRAEAFRRPDDRGDFSGHLYRTSCSRLFDQAWSCAEDVLSAESLLDLARWWMRSAGGERHRRYPECSRSLAIMLSRRSAGTSADVRRSLLASAEASERTDEETSALAPGLFACAQAWGACGFVDEANRLWRELLDIGCGLYWRKDYQFNEIMEPLKLAHAVDPAGSLDRVREQLGFAHQLVGTATGRTIAVAIQALVTFVARFDMPLALRGIVQEDPLLHRDSALGDLIDNLIERHDVDLRWSLALAATMGPWENINDFDDHANPAMFAIYSAALSRRQFALARVVYDRWRHMLLVQKERPSEIHRWAVAWAAVDTPPADVAQDLQQFPPATNAERPEVEVGKDLAPFAGELTSFVHDRRELEARLEQRIAADRKEERSRDLEHAQVEMRKAFAKALGSDWREAYAAEFDACFAEFREAALATDAGSKSAAASDVAAALDRLVSTTSARLAHPLTTARFREFFDIEEWLDRFIRPGTSPYFIQRMIEERLPSWIASAAFSELEEWHDFCSRRCERDSRAAGLIALAKRRAKADPERAIAHLVAAWECASEFFHERQTVSREICSLLLDLDRARGIELLFGSFMRQYERYPESIIIRLDEVLRFSDRLGDFDAVRLYRVWADYNRCLAAGLSRKDADLDWLTDSDRPGLGKACIRYLLAVLEYPEIDIQLLAADELYRLATERHEAVEAILDAWGRLSDGVKEHVATVFYSLVLSRPELLRAWGAQVLELGRREPHRNTRVTIAEAIERLANSAESVAAAAALVEPPAVLLGRGSVVHPPSADSPWLPPYLEWAQGRLSNATDDDDLEESTTRELALQYPKWSDGMDDESAVHMQHNINTNFDVIEICGAYGRAVRSALNRAVQSLVDEREVNYPVLRQCEDVLRFRDPSDVLCRRVSRPPGISWIDDELADEGFLGFSDLNEYAGGVDEWVTIFEHTEQRISDEHGHTPIRVAKVRLAAVLVTGAAPTSAEIEAEERRGCLSPMRNRYRFELATATRTAVSSRFSAVVVSANRSFRGRTILDVACVAQAVSTALGLRPADDDLLGRVDIAGKSVARSSEWQEAFDQHRRRHEPNSSGFLLQMRRDVLTDYAARAGADVWVTGTVRRTTDRYKPEEQMNWARHRVLFRIKS